MNSIEFYGFDCEIELLCSDLQREFGTILVLNNWFVPGPPPLCHTLREFYDAFSEGRTKRRYPALTLPELLDDLKVESYITGTGSTYFLRSHCQPVIDIILGEVMIGTKRPESLADWFGTVDIIRPTDFFVSRSSKGNKKRPDFVQSPKILELHKNIRAYIKKRFLPMPNDCIVQTGYCSAEVVQRYREGTLAFHGMTNEHGTTYFLYSQGEEDNGTQNAGEQ